METIEYDMNNISDNELIELNELAKTGTCKATKKDLESSFNRLNDLQSIFRVKLQSVQNLSEFDEIQANLNRYNVYLKRIITNYELKDNIKYPVLVETYLNKLKKLEVLSNQMWENSKDERLFWERMKNEKTEPQNTAKTEMIFIYNLEMILSVYNFLVNNNELDCTIASFMKAVEIADFKSLKPLTKVKTKELIYKLQVDGFGKLGNNWYTKACQSIGVQKGHCHNLDISDEWKKGLEYAIIHGNKKNINKN